MRNQTFNYHPCDKVCFEVPRETDLSYQNQKRNGWQFRIYAQMLKRKSENYSSYFFTLTYSDENMPYFELKTKKYYDFVNKDYSYDVLRCMCFSREDIRRFVRGVQQDLLRYYNIKDIDYVICSEYGKNTQRSHYHGVFIVPNTYTITINGKDRLQTFTSVELHSLIKKHWSKITQRVRDGRRWRYTRQLLGWVLPSRACPSQATGKKPLKINDADLTNAAIYVSKYCTKDLTFYGRKDILKVQKALSQSESDYIKEKRKEFRSCLPFLKCSQHFGECITEMVLGDGMPAWCNDCCSGGDSVHKAVDGIKTPLHNKCLTQIPDYIKRKLFEKRVPVSSFWFRPNVYKEHDMTILDYDEDKLELVGKQAPKVFVYEYEVYKTDFFRSCLPYLYRRTIDKCQERFEDFYINYFETKEFDEWLLNRYSVFSDTNDEWQLDYNKSKTLLYEFIHSCHALAVYNCVYRNRCNPLHYADYLQDEKRELTERKYNKRYFVSHDITLVPCSTYNYQSRRYDYDVRPIEIEDVFDVDGSIAPVVLDRDSAFLYEEFVDDSDTPVFYGDESLSTMLDHAYDFYKSVGDVVRYPTCRKSAPNEQSALHFNSFVCFRSFDYVLLLIEDYMSEISNSKLLLQRNKEDIKKRDKDMFNKI